VGAVGTGAGAPDGVAGRDPPDQAQLGQLAEEQAALRRVATLVARATPPEAVFAAVAEEVGQLLPVNSATMCRYEYDGTLTFVAHWGAAVARFPVGTRRTLGGHNLGTLVFESGRPARVDGYADSSSGALGVVVREAALRSAVGTPIIVDGRLWGLIAAGSSLEQPLPPDTETRLASFTELVAMAVANTDGRAALARLAQADVAADRGDLRAELSRIAAGLGDAVAELQELSRGIHPAILSERGLGPALRALARRSAVPVDLDVTTSARCPEPVEIAAYYVASEALANAMKHAQASRIEISLATRDGSLASLSIG
jgi:GAF domain-containing protein